MIEAPEKDDRGKRNQPNPIISCAPCFPATGFNALSRLPHLTLIPLDQLLAQQALEVAALHRLLGSDAVYAAVAQRFACSMVTLDNEQHDRVAATVKTYYLAELSLLDA